MPRLGHIKGGVAVREGRILRGVLVRVLSHTRTDRGMTLAPFATRCVLRGSVHELVTTDQRRQTAGNAIDRVGFVGFIEFANSGLIARGDMVYRKGDRVGTVLGFDECHAPNHYNLLIETEELLTGLSLGMGIEDSVEFVPPEAE